MLSSLLFCLGVLVSSESPIQVGDGISIAEGIFADSDSTKHFFPFLEIEILTDPPFLKMGLVRMFARNGLILHVDSSDVHKHRRAIYNLKMIKAPTQLGNCYVLGLFNIIMLVERKNEYSWIGI